MRSLYFRAKIRVLGNASESKKSSEKVFQGRKKLEKAVSVAKLSRNCRENVAKLLIFRFCPFRSFFELILKDENTSEKVFQCQKSSPNARGVAKLSRNYRESVAKLWRRGPEGNGWKHNASPKSIGNTKGHFSKKNFYIRALQWKAPKNFQQRRPRLKTLS